MKRTVFVVVAVLLAVSLLMPATGNAWRGHRYHGGWHGSGAFAGGFLLGAAVAAPWYYAPPPPRVYVYTPPPVVYAPPPAYAYPDPAYPGPAQSQPPAPQASAGQWIDVPGQTVNGVWVPGHKAWVPNNP